MVGLNLEEVLFFPFKDDEARKHFFIGCAIALASFVIPILPYFLLVGYAAQIARQTLRYESPRMIAWTDWEKLFTDGFKLFVIRFVYALPIVLLALPLLFVFVPLLLTDSDSDLFSGMLMLAPLLLPVILLLIIVAVIALSLFLPAIEMRFIDTEDLSSAFRVREWWKIFRANIGGFAIVLVFTYIVGFLLSIATQFVMLTLIFACLLIFITPAVTFYMLLTPYVLAARAYREGKDKLPKNEHNVIFAQ
ncbi:MAG: DUF4013 domain-containing protein [Anaerolineales bacterium]|nr:DUF4013 domain-containing protein [Anaerolineales bacterium]